MAIKLVAMKMLLETFFERNYLEINHQLASRSITLYRYTIRKFGQHIGKPAELDDLTNANVASYMRSFIDAGLANETANKERSNLLALARAARDDGLIQKVPRVKPFARSGRIPTALHVAEVNQLLDACDILVEPERQLFRFLIATQYATAERIGAVLQLQWTDIANRFITFRGETRKCGTRSIIKSVPQYVIDSLEAIRTNDLFVFPRMKGTGKMLLLFDRLFKRAGVPRPKWKSSHLLRSTHATFLNLAGQDATESLGHANSSTTKKSYLDPRMKDAHYWTFLPSIEPQ